MCNDKSRFACSRKQRRVALLDGIRGWRGLELFRATCAAEVVFDSFVGGFANFLSGRYRRAGYRTHRDTLGVNIKAALDNALGDGLGSCA